MKVGTCLAFEQWIYIFERFVIEYIIFIECRCFKISSWVETLNTQLKYFIWYNSSWMFFMFWENKYVFVKCALTKIYILSWLCFSLHINATRVFYSKSVFSNGEDFSSIWSVYNFWHHQHNNEHVKFSSFLFQWKFMTRCTVHT